ncbi:minor capsid protein [Tuberibacillus calidus]|uniref:minor capsid protein n=1 Tax=Tuberibacillus calidus TaxID=340097 RepID=UPI0004812B3F|nr:minor capsid protein [Tuberibacillus calidus]
MSKLEDAILEIFDQMFKLTDKEHQEILKMYKKSRDNIKAFVAEVFMKYGQDGKVNYADLQKYNRMATIEKQIKDEIQLDYNDEVKIMVGILALVYAQAFYRTAFALEQNLKVGINFKLLKPEFIKEIVNFNWSGIPFSERIWKNRTSLINSLREALFLGIQNGDSLDKIARAINKLFNVKAYQSLRLIRTESARVITQAQEKLYRDSGVTEKVKWLATLDAKTDSECRELDGKIFDIDDPYKPKIPKHPNCRCCYVPVLDDYQPSKRKDNESKDIIENMTYEEWAEQKNIP